MHRVADKESDDFYMYKFRTSPCTKKPCRKPKSCVNAHSMVSRRRVPMQGCKGLFNYIPKPCPEWEKHKKCILRDRCPQAHGWLEMIYHPLLYKTKMCEPYQKSGVCRKYGVYCAKAHNVDEIRNLVKIYGWNWKRHYDLTQRESSPKLINKSAHRFGKAPVLKNAESFESETILKYLEGFPSELSNSLRNLCLNEKQRMVGTQSNMNQSRSRAVKHTLESASLFSPLPLFGVSSKVYDQMPDISREDAVSHYTELYGKKFVNSENGSSTCSNESSCPPQIAENMSLTTLLDSPTSTSDTYFLSPTNSSKTAETNDSSIDGMMDWKQLKSDDENWPWREDNNRKYLFDLDHDGIWSKHIFGFQAQKYNSGKDSKLQHPK